MKKKIVYSVIFLMVMFILLLFLAIRPAIVGYTVYREMEEANSTLDDYSIQVDTLSTDLSTLQNQCEGSAEKLAAAELELKKAQMEVKMLDISLEAFSKERDGLMASQQTEFDQEIGIMNTKLDRCENDVKSWKNDYEDLMENSAENICCKRKLDNPDIGYYSVRSDRIICLEDDGNEKLKCTFD